MLTKEIVFGATLFFVGFIPFVLSKNAYTINREILDMKEHAKALTEEHTKLDAALKKLEEECKSKIKELVTKNVHIEEQRKAKALELTSVIYEHSQAKIEERFSMDALNTAYTMRNKYALKVELYTQELEQLQNRRTTKLSERCHRMKPEFDNYGTKLSTRSLPGELKPSNRAEIVVLQNQLNQEKVIVTALINKVSNLKDRIKSTGESCEKDMKAHQEKFASTATVLNKILEDLDVVKIDLKELRANSILIQKQLKSIREDGERLKAQSISLRHQIEKYFEDKQCYKRIAGLTFQFK